MNELFPAEPGVFGIRWDVYSYKSTFAEAIADADRELLPRGFRKSEDLRVHSTTYEFGRLEFPTYTSVTINSGRVTGKHFHIDGDYLDIAKDPNWVEVDVQYVDPDPAWIQWIKFNLP